MGLATTLVGACGGVGTIMYCNALRKVAFFKRMHRPDPPAPFKPLAHPHSILTVSACACAGPWEHVLAGIFCAWGAHKFVLAEDFLRARVAVEADAHIEANREMYEGQFRKILGDRFDGFFENLKAKRSS